MQRRLVLEGATPQITSAQAPYRARARQRFVVCHTIGRGRVADLVDLPIVSSSEQAQLVLVTDAGTGLAAGAFEVRG